MIFGPGFLKQNKNAQSLNVNLHCEMIPLYFKILKCCILKSITPSCFHTKKCAAVVSVYPEGTWDVREARSSTPKGGSRLHFLRKEGRGRKCATVI